MEFEKTELGAVAARWFANRWGIAPRYEHLQVRRWCEWHLLKWGKDGARELFKMFVRYVEQHARNPRAYAVYMMKEANEHQWLRDEDYERFKRKWLEDYKRYRDHVIDTDEGGHSISESVSEAMREMKRAAPQRLAR